jgi:hypothetical protein
VWPCRISPCQLPGLTRGGFGKAVFFAAAGIAILISLADEQQEHLSRNRTNLPKVKSSTRGALVWARGFDLVTFVDKPGQTITAASDDAVRFFKKYSFVRPPTDRVSARGIQKLHIFQIFL